MIIQTKSIQTTPNQMFRLFMRHYLEKRWRVGLIFFGLIIINIIGILRGNLDAMPLSFLLIILVLVVYVNWRKFYAKKEKGKYFTVNYSIEQHQIIINQEKASRTINTSDFSNIIEKKDYFLLFYSKNDFLYFPFSLFKNQADLQQFRKWLNGLE